MPYTILIEAPNEAYAKGVYTLHGEAETALYERAEDLEDYDEDYMTTSGYNDGSITMTVIDFIE